MRHRALALGWMPEAIAIIDEDQGRSAASADHRQGFQRLVAEIAAGAVGLVLMLEASRLARCGSGHFNAWGTGGIHNVTSYQKGPLASMTRSANCAINPWKPSGVVGVTASRGVGDTEPTPSGSGVTGRGQRER